MRRLTTGLAIVLLTLALAGPVSAGRTMQPISGDPYTNPDTWHATEVEPDSVAVGDLIISAFQVGRAPNGGASNIGWARSADGGVTWTHGYLPGITTVEGGPYHRATDSVVAYDALHDVWMISYVAFNIQDGVVGPPAAVMVSRSTDDGLTWGAPISMDQQLTQPVPDKNWTVCDNHLASPYYGHCYTQYSAPSPTPDGYPLSMVVRTSTDGGLTWGPAIGVNGAQYGGGGQPVVQPNGTVVIPFEQLSKTDESFSALAAYRSTDGGASWGDTVEIANARLFNRPQHDIRLGMLPSATVDDQGQVYLVWNDCRFEPNCTAMDVVFTTSMDGMNWTPIRRIPFAAVGSGRSYMLPAIEVESGTFGANAHIGIVTYYLEQADCKTNQCWLHAVFMFSADGGTSWGPRIRLGPPMKLKWFPHTGPGYMFGDYYAVSFAADGSAVPIIPIAAKPDGAVMDVAMSSTRI